jgi:hypothetical protein
MSQLAHVLKHLVEAQLRDLPLVFEETLICHKCKIGVL